MSENTGIVSTGTCVLTDSTHILKQCSWLVNKVEIGYQHIEI